ncbi:hypothetical protein CHUAL_003519 [Chamberlinius hualienensis]
MHEIHTLSFMSTQQRHRHLMETNSSKWGVSLGSLHLSLGFLSVILGIVGLISEYHATKYGSSLWCGIIFELTGVSGVVASRKWYSRVHLKCFCLSSIVAIFSSIILFSLTCVGIANHYVDFNPKLHTSVSNYMANVSANIIVLSMLEIGVSLVSVTVTFRSMKRRYTSTSMAQPVVVRETFMTPLSDVESEHFSSHSHHSQRLQYVSVPDVLLQGVMPSVFNVTKLAARQSTLSNGISHPRQLLDVNNLIGDEDNQSTYSYLSSHQQDIFEKCDHKIDNNIYSVGRYRNY